MSDESYYRALAVIDRIFHEGKSIKNMQRIAKAAKLHANYISQTYSYGAGATLTTVLRLAAAMDVSLEYLLTGKNKQAYSPLEVSFEKIMNLKSAPGKIFSHSLIAIKSKIKHGTLKNTRLKTAFDFEQVSGVPVAKLFFKEKCNG